MPSPPWLTAMALFCPHSPAHQVPGHSQVRQLGGLKGQPLDMLFAPRKILSVRGPGMEAQPWGLSLWTASSVGLPPHSDHLLSSEWWEKVGRFHLLGRWQSERVKVSRSLREPG